jgi:hypothetical protein
MCAEASVFPIHSLLNKARHGAETVAPNAPVLQKPTMTPVLVAAISKVIG